MKVTELIDYLAKIIEDDVDLEQMEVIISFPRYRNYYKVAEVDTDPNQTILRLTVDD